MWIPRVVEGELAKDTTTAWGTSWPKGAMVLLLSELKDKQKGGCLVSLPNPVPAYLAIVEDSLSTAKFIRKNMFGDKTQFPDKPGQPIFTDIKIKEFDEYFQVVTALTIFSFIALEAWCNQIIPENYIYIRRKGHSTIEEKLDKSAIERSVSLDEKLEHIIPAVLTKPHFKSKKLWHQYKRAKAARDEFTHLKSPAKIGSDKTNYDPFFQRVLDIDLDEVAKLPKEIMLYFIPKDLGF